MKTTSQLDAPHSAAAPDGQRKSLCNNRLLLLILGWIWPRIRNRLPPLVVVEKLERKCSKIDTARDAHDNNITAAVFTY